MLGLVLNKLGLPHNQLLHGAGAAISTSRYTSNSGGGGLFSSLLKTGLTAAAGSFGGPLGAFAANAILSEPGQTGSGAPATGIMLNKVY